VIRKLTWFFQCRFDLFYLFVLCSIFRKTFSDIQADLLYSYCFWFVSDNPWYWTQFLKLHLKPQEQFIFWKNCLEQIAGKSCQKQTDRSHHSIRFEYYLYDSLLIYLFSIRDYYFTNGIKIIQKFKTFIKLK